MYSLNEYGENFITLTEADSVERRTFAGRGVTQDRIPQNKRPAGGR